jgi:electron transfer flavoprotein alpha subunit
MSGILVVVEQARGALHKMSLETLAAGQQLGAELGVPVRAVVMGTDLAALAAQLGGYRLESVLALEHDALREYTADGAVAALSEFIAELSPSLVLFPHTYQVRDYAPKLAARHGAVLISDVTSASVEAGQVTFQRQLLQGKLNAAYRGSGAVVFASLQAGAWRAEGLESGTAPVEVRAAKLDPASIRQQPEPPFQESARAVDLSAAEIIVSVGRGIGEEGNLPVVQELAEALGGEVAASRPICDNGWLPMERQVGSSGQTVAPKVYFAVGISGAIQHLVGMKGSQCIVAINRDANAPIFEVADYGVVGDLFEVVPALTAEVKKARGQ